MFDTSLDKSNFYQVIKDFPSQFSKARDLIGDMKIEGDFNRLVICGMGGSAMPYDLLRAYFAYKKIHLPIDISRTYSLPHFANEKTLIFISSYSGNTEEALECMKEAQERGLTYVGFSRAGKIEEMSAEYGYQYVQYPEEGETFQPRNAIGYSFSAMAFLLMNSGLIPENHDEILELEHFLSNLSVEDHAKQVAQDIDDLIPVVYSADEYQNTAARIVKIKFNENAKMSAFYNSFPELNHNEMVGFTTHAKRFHFIFMRDAASHERVNMRMDITRDILKEYGASYSEVELQGETFLQKMFAGIVFGDYMTYYRSLLNRIDPTPVDMVEDFKKKLV